MLDNQQLRKIVEEVAAQLGLSPDKVRHMEEESWKIVRLKKKDEHEETVEIEATKGWIILGALGTLLAENPEQFQTLLALAEGQAVAIDPQHMAYLRDWGFVGGPDENMTSKILLAAYKETTEGTVLVNPFDVADLNEARTLENEEEMRQQRAIRRLQSRIKRWEDDEGRSL
jgi:hypothetical protein